MHFLLSSGRGHYTAHCAINDDWFHFNDRLVKKCTIEDVQTQQAYLLFYKSTKL